MMTTSLVISTAGLTAGVSTESDESAQLVLLRFAHATGAPVEATNQEKLDHVALQLADYMQRVARERYILEESANIQQDAIDNVHW